VAFQCAVMQLAHREVVELASDSAADVESASAVNLEPTLYPQVGIELSFSGMRTPPKEEQQADTALSLLPQHPGALGMVVVALLMMLPWTWMKDEGVSRATSTLRLCTAGHRMFEEQSPNN